jgi:CubicO group peptidase (beta-lactamase class C family)
MNKNKLKNTTLGNHLNKIYLIFIVLVGLSACSAGSHDLSSLMDLYSQEGQHNRIQSPFNGVMLVAKDDRVIHRKAYGFYDKSNKKPLVEESAFLIGSITKQFTAMLVLQQVEKGKLTLTSTIDEYLPNLPVEKGARITLHDLLAHSPVCRITRVFGS